MHHDDGDERGQPAGGDGAVWARGVMAGDAAAGCGCAAILCSMFAELPEPIGAANSGRLTGASHGLTGADLKNIVGDGKLLYAHDRCTGTPMRAVDEYFPDAIATVRGNRRSYARSKPPRMTETVKMGFGVE